MLNFIHLSNVNIIILFSFDRAAAPNVTLQGNLDPACLYASHVCVIN